MTECRPYKATQQVFDGILQVRTIRSKNPMGFGGCIFGGYEVDMSGKIKDPTTFVVVKARTSQLPTQDSVERGEHWHVVGRAQQMLREQDGYQMKELVVDPTSVLKVRESGEAIIFAIAVNKRFKGIGEVKARALWNRFGEELYDILDRGDVGALTKQLSDSEATLLAEEWKDHVPSQIFAFLQKFGIAVSLSQKVVSAYGKNAERLLREDPYRLLSFSASWKQVDALAQNKFGLQPHDPLRLRGSLEESLYSLLGRHHTAATKDMLEGQVQALLSIKNNEAETERLVEMAFADNASNGSYILAEDELYHSVGPYLMEKEIAGRINGMIADNPVQIQSLFMASLTKDKVNEMITGFEEQEQRRSHKAIKLYPDQLESVHKCISNRFSVVTGGAGVGKTTVLKCLHHVLSETGHSTCQMALSGRAAKRMQDATGKTAYTIAKYIKRASQIKATFGNDVCFIIDESSMLDLQTTYKLFESMPNNMRLVLVGDPHQLPPIGAGLIFQVLAEMDRVPKTELTQNLRQDASTGIPYVADGVRHGHLPALPYNSTSGVKFIDCKRTDILEKALSFHLQAPDETQILCATKKCSQTGVIAINQACQDKYTNGSQFLFYLNESIGEICYSGIRINDRILFTQNDYSRGVMNGSLGKLLKVFNKPKPYEDYKQFAIALADVEGDIVPIFQSDFYGQPTVQLGYAVTVHKAQGSQFRRVIIPILNNRILDRTFFYTAITRAEDEVILVGDMEALRRAIENPPKARNRVIGFKHLLEALKR